MKYRHCMVIAGLALIPNLFVFTYFGQQIFQRDELSLIIAAVSLILRSIFVLLILERVRNQPTPEPNMQPKK